MSYTTMTWSEYLREAEEFLKIAHYIGDSWEIIKKNDEDGYSWLVFKQKIPFQSANKATTIDDELAAAEEIINLSQTTKLESIDGNHNGKHRCTDEMLTIEYHLVYSLSYQVPMLFMQGHKCDGSLLQLEEAWQLFQTSLADIKTAATATATTTTPLKREELLQILTPMEHPLLYRPFLALHPCRTAVILEQAGASQNRILTFLSLMGPFVHLHLNNEYGKAFQNNSK